jgi:8-oxo-dGTP pyrophosphatase MutT (NUDIX family)
MKKWKIIKETDVSPSHWFPVMQHTVELENGKRVDDYFTAPLGDSVVVLPFTTTGEIVLIRQYRHGIREIVTELPGGFKQKDKTLVESAIAELEEETGIRTTPEQLIPLGRKSNLPSKSNHMTYGYIARDVVFNSSQNLEETESIEILTRPPKVVIEMVLNEEIWIGDSAVHILKAYLRYPELFQ